MNYNDKVMIPGTPQTLQNLLRFREDEEAKALFAKLDIAWASKAELVDQLHILVLKLRELYLLMKPLHFHHFGPWTS